jgi:serine/threonine protein kinase
MHAHTLRKFNKCPRHLNSPHIILTRPPSQCALAMFYLHSNHIYIKSFDPKHIVLDQYGHVKLTHFGYRYDNADVGGTRSNIFYLAPELIMSKDWNNSRKIQRQRDMRSLVESDYWSLGILVYELFCGAYPFTTDGEIPDSIKLKDLKAIRLQILRASYTIPAGDIPPDVVTYIHAMLALNPSDRSAVFQDYHGNNNTVNALILQSKKALWSNAGIVCLVYTQSSF